MVKQLFLGIRLKFKEHPELWFFVFASFVFVAMYIWSLLTVPGLSMPMVFIAFTSLTLVHIGIHWTLLLIGEFRRWFWPYIIGQGILALAIIYLSQNIGMIFALYMALIGETIGMTARKSWRFFAVLIFVLLSLAGYILLNGTEDSLWWLLGTTPMIIFVVLYVSLYARESNARTQAQTLLEKLEKANQQLAEYANRVEQLTLFTERQRMARELHDTLAQGLAGLILQLEAADSHISADNQHKAQTIIQQAMERARSTLADARLAIGDLRAAPGTPTDLAAAIRAEVDHFTDTTGISVSLGLCTLQKLPSQLTENTLRSVSEGLMNIAKHAQATEVVLKMTCPENDLIVELFDNGIGFNPAEAVGKSGHYGLLGMRERTRILGGSLTIQSQPARGTTLKIQLPLVGD